MAVWIDLVVFLCLYVAVTNLVVLLFPFTRPQPTGFEPTLGGSSGAEEVGFDIVVAWRPLSPGLFGPAPTLVWVLVLAWIYLTVFEASRWQATLARRPLGFLC